MSTQSSADESLDAKVRAVEEARERLVKNIGVMDREVRMEALEKMEDFAWKAVAGITAAAAGIATTKVLSAAWGALRDGRDVPDDPADPNVSTADALLWTGLTGLGVGIAVVLAQRGAATGWRKATGQVPPKFQHAVIKK